MKDEAKNKKYERPFFGHFGQLGHFNLESNSNLRGYFRLLGHFFCRSLHPSCLFIIRFIVSSFDLSIANTVQNDQNNKEPGRITKKQ